MGRPRKEINWDQFTKLCYIHATLEEIAGLLEVSADTIERACKRKYKKLFAEVYREKAALGKVSLRRTMFKKAVEGADNTMLIWLSKNHLGMSDKNEETVKQENPAQVNVIWQSVASPNTDDDFYDK